MRYSLLPDGTTAPVQNTGAMVEMTVWFTLFCGIALVLLGLHGRQRWLQCWGGLTIVCSLVYFMRGMLGFEAIL